MEEVITVITGELIGVLRCYQKNGMAMFITVNIKAFNLAVPALRACAATCVGSYQKYFQLSCSLNSFSGNRYANTVYDIHAPPLHACTYAV